MKLVCPNCGHDGTPGTAKTPQGSLGFNYLSDDIVYREVRADEETGRLLLSSDSKCEGSGGANPRIECRSCWQTFPVPVGFRVDVAALATEPEAVPAPAEPAQPVAAAGTFDAASRLVENLAALLHEAVVELERPMTEKLAELEAWIEPVTRQMDEIPQVHAEAAALSEALQALASRVATTETAVAAQAQGQPQISEQLRNFASGQEAIHGRIEEQANAIVDLRALSLQMQDSQQAEQESHRGWLESFEGKVAASGELSAALAELQRGLQVAQARLDAQADAIRVLHLAAQDRLARKEELQAALQRLEQIAGALEEPTPLPEQL